MQDNQTNLQATAPGYGGQQTVYFWLKTPILDLTRHTGEMLAMMEAYKRLILED